MRASSTRAGKGLSRRGGSRPSESSSRASIVGRKPERADLLPIDRRPSSRVRSRATVGLICPDLEGDIVLLTGSPGHSFGTLNGRQTVGGVYVLRADT